MKKWITILLIISAFAAVGWISYSEGYSKGLQKGFSYGEACVAGGTAFYSVRVLKVLRKGETDKAIDLLERKLDADIFVYRSTREDVKEFEDNDTRKYLREVADYRKEVPSTISSPETKKTIDSFVAKYATK